MSGQARKKIDQGVGHVGTAAGVVGTGFDSVGKTAPRVLPGIGLLTGGWGLVKGAEELQRGVYDPKEHADFVASGLSTASGALGLAGATGGLAQAGAVAGAAAAGYGVGSLMAEAADSEAAKSTGWFGKDAHTGKNRSYLDFVGDMGTAADTTVDAWVGGEEGSLQDSVGDVLGTAAGVGTSAWGGITLAGAGLASAGVGALSSLFD